MSEATFLILLAWGGAHTDGEMPPGVEHRPGFVEAVRAVAVAQNWAFPGEHVQDLEAARVARWWCDDAPAAYPALHVLPGQGWLDEQAAFGQARLDWLEGQANLAAAPWQKAAIHDAMNDVRRLRDAYQHLSWARHYARPEEVNIDGVNDYWPRRSLSQVRYRLRAAAELVGDDFLTTGVLPPVVPLHQFQRVER